jgi:hypothetical protein
MGGIKSIWEMHLTHSLSHNLQTILHIWVVLVDFFYSFASPHVCVQCHSKTKQGKLTFIERYLINLRCAVCFNCQRFYAFF